MAVPFVGDGVTARHARYSANSQDVASELWHASWAQRREFRSARLCQLTASDATATGARRRPLEKPICWPVARRCMNRTVAAEFRAENRITAWRASSNSALVRSGRWRPSGSEQHRQDRGVGMADRVDTDATDHRGDGAVGFCLHPGRTVLEPQIRQPGQQHASRRRAVAFG